MKSYITAFIFITTTGLSVAQAQSRAVVGETRNAMPGLINIGVIERDTPNVSFAGSTGYGFTEGVLNDNDKHHRVYGSFAAALRLAPWFMGGLELTGRFDKHSGDMGADESFVGNPKIYLRSGTILMERWAIGAQAVVWFPGNEFPSVKFGATTLDAEALISYRTGTDKEGFRFAGRAGYRIDQSRKSVDNADDLSLPDRLSLGLNDNNALLVGLGVLWHSDRLELMGEWTWDKLMGKDAPKSSFSPMLVSAGVRYALGRERLWRFFGSVQTSPSSRPPITTGAPLINVEPRIAMIVGLSYRASLTPQAPIMGEVPVEIPGQLTVRVSDIKDVPLHEVSVEVKGPDDERNFFSDQAGRVTADKLPQGTYRVSVLKEGYESLTKDIVITSGARARLDFTLNRTVPIGYLRGFVRSFSGEGLVAKVMIPALNIETVTKDDGSFELKVAPGTHKVLIRATGYSDQTRKVEIEDEGAVLLNVDMRRGR